MAKKTHLTIKLFRAPMASAFVLYHGTKIAGTIYPTVQGKYEAHLPDGTSHRYNVRFTDAARSLLNPPTACDLGRCNHKGCLDGMF